MEQHILDLVARNIREQALQRASDDLGEALALVWKEAALKARLEAVLVPTPEGSPLKNLPPTQRWSRIDHRRPGGGSVRTTDGGAAHRRSPGDWGKHMELGRVRSAHSAISTFF